MRCETTYSSAQTLLIMHCNHVYMHTIIFPSIMQRIAWKTLFYIKFSFNIWLTYFFTFIHSSYTILLLYYIFILLYFLFVVVLICFSYWMIVCECNFSTQLPLPVYPKKVLPAWLLKMYWVYLLCRANVNVRIIQCASSFIIVLLYIVQ